MANFLMVVYVSHNSSQYG